jgi:hypothetical protein
MMNTIDSSSRTAENSKTSSIIRLHIHVISTNDNSHDYSSFDMHLVSNYMNNQLIYYFIISAISAAAQTEFQQLMKKHKDFLQLLE